jgi:glycosyltransferase involved in cell wall biosynthesis
MRVLHVNAGNLFGGVEVLLTTLARQGHLCPTLEPHFAVCFAGRLHDELAAAGAGVARLGAVRVRYPWSVLRARRNLRTLLRREPFDAVICHAAWTQVVFGPVVRAWGLPLVFWLHDPPHETLFLLERWAQRTPPDLAVCNSEYTRARLPRLYPQARGEVVYCPVPPPPDPPTPAERDAVRATFGASPGDVVIVQVGRLAVHKGHLIHLEALGRLRHLPGWVCWQVGAPQGRAEESYYSAVRAAAAELGLLDRVRFLGWQPDVRRVLAAADLYCQPNTLPEPFGITFVEALLAGLPVVATAAGGPKEFIDDRCGILVAAGDAEGLAGALAALIRETDLRRRLSAGGPGRAQALCEPATQIGRLAEVLGAVTPARCS